MQALTPAAIEFRGIDKSFGSVHAVRGVSLRIEPGTITGIVGENGAGKSTLMKLVMGLIEADDGDRSVQAGVRFAYVPQEPVIAGDTLLDYATAANLPPPTVRISRFGANAVAVGAAAAVGRAPIDCPSCRRYHPLQNM